MKKANIQVGGTYTVKVGARVVHCRIESENPRGGWEATNLATGKRIKIKTAQRLRGTVQAPRPPRAPRRPAPEPVAEPTPVTTPVAPVSTEQPTTRRPSLLTAAAQVLAQTRRPMGAREIVEAVAAAGLWSSPAGKTPHLTLSSAIIREIAQNGDESRFCKVARGQFEAKTTAPA